MPYATFYPELTKNLIYTGWAREQWCAVGAGGQSCRTTSAASGANNGAGMVQEVLGSMGSGGLWWSRVLRGGPKTGLRFVCWQSIHSRGLTE